MSLNTYINKVMLASRISEDTQLLDMVNILYKFVIVGKAVKMFDFFRNNNLVIAIIDYAPEREVGLFVQREFVNKMLAQQFM